MALALVFVCEDGHVCPTCVGAAREPRRFADMRPGENYPPLHPRCRCVVNPHVTDWDAWLDRQADREAARTKARRMGASVAEPLVKAKGGEANRYTVDYKAVNSKGFHDKFEALPYQKPAREALYRIAGRMLSNKDGTRGGRLAAIDARTGAVVADTFSEAPEEGRTYFDAEQRDAITSNPGKAEFLHNHPGGSDPSYEDISSALTNEQMEGSVITGHNGKVYLIYPEKREEARVRLVELFRMAKELTSDGDLARDMARQKLLEENDGKRWMQCVEIKAGPR